MRFIENIRRKLEDRKNKNRAELVLLRLGLDDKGVCDTFVGPDYEKGWVVDVKGEDFLGLIDELGISEVRERLSYLGHTNRSYELFFLTDGLWVRTIETEDLYLSSFHERTVFDDLFERGFDFTKPFGVDGPWATYRRDV